MTLSASPPTDLAQPRGPMSDKPDKKSDEKGAAPTKDAAPPAETKKGGGFLKSTPALMAVVMVIEAVLLFAGFKMFGGSPKSAQGSEFASGDAKEEHDSHGDAHSSSGHGDSHGGGSAAPADKKKTAEIPVIDFKAPNRQ